MKAQANPHAVLRRLFLTLFLRGRSARGRTKEGAPATLHRKLFLTLLFYSALGCLALYFVRQPLFGFAFYLHTMAFVFIGMYVAGSAGEVLFCREEADILLHRPIAPRALLWAKARVMVEVSLWLAGAFSLVGLLTGLFVLEHGVRFVFVHATSLGLLALFTTGSIVLIYQLCLRFFGRKRLESLLTLAQMLLATAIVLAGQLPNLLLNAKFSLPANASFHTGWLALLPPAWFAGLDDALCGEASVASWLLALLALAFTALVAWLGFLRLAQDYQKGIQALEETPGLTPASREAGSLLNRMVNRPPLSWSLRDPVTRASFLLTAAYLLRDRDVKLRVYPGLAPYLLLPLILIFQVGGKLGLALLVAFLGIIPIVAQSLLQHSQQWQASDTFRTAPIPGPAKLCDGGRQAVMVLLVLPVLVVISAVLVLFPGDPSRWMLLVAGLIAMPVAARLPLGTSWVPPLSLPPGEAKSTDRGFLLFCTTAASLLLAGLAFGAQSLGMLKGFLLAEAVLAAVAYILLRRALSKQRWAAID